MSIPEMQYLYDARIKSLKKKSQAELAAKKMERDMKKQ